MLLVCLCTRVHAPPWNDDERERKTPFGGVAQRLLLAQQQDDDTREASGLLLVVSAVDVCLGFVSLCMCVFEYGQMWRQNNLSQPRTKTSSSSLIITMSDDESVTRRGERAEKEEKEQQARRRENVGRIKL